MVRKNDDYQLDKFSSNSISYEASTLYDSNEASSIDQKFIRLNNKSKFYLFPIIYFFSSTFFLIMLLIFNLQTPNSNGVIKHYAHEGKLLVPFRSLSTFKNSHTQLFYASMILTTLSGIINFCFLCKLLIQRFSVPEFKDNKVTVQLMFVFGITANAIYLSFFFFPEIINFELSKIKFLRFSLSMIIFISFIFFNLLFAALTLNVFQNFKKQIAYNDKRLKKNIKTKACLVCISLFLITLYIIAVYSQYSVSNTSHNFVLKNKNKNKFELLKKKEMKHFNSILKINQEHHDENYSPKKTTISDKNEKLNIGGFKIFYTYILENVRIIIKLILFSFPYLLFFLNSLINLTYYSDMIYLEEIINIIIDKGYFFDNNDSLAFLSELSL